MVRSFNTNVFQNRQRQVSESCKLAKCSWHRLLICVGSVFSICCVRLHRTAPHLFRLSCQCRKPQLLDVIGTDCCYGACIFFRNRVDRSECYGIATGRDRIDQSAESNQRGCKNHDLCQRHRLNANRSDHSLGRDQRPGTQRDVPAISCTLIHNA